MKQTRKLTYLVTVLLLALLSLSLVSCSGSKKPVRSADIAVLYTGDVHCAVDESIGCAGLAAFKQEIEAQGAEVLLVDTGDSIPGAPISTLPIEIMNHLGYCAMVLGNHEFSYGQETLHKLSTRANFPFLSLNFVD